MVVSKSMAWAWHDLVCMIFVQQRCCKFERGEMHLFDMVHKVGEARCVHNEIIPKVYVVHVMSGNHEHGDHG
jgi:hypothetical protein